MSRAQNRMSAEQSAPSLPINLSYFAPAPDLRAYISSYYLFSTSLPQIADITRAETAQLRFMLRGGGTYSFGGAEPVRAPTIGMLGATCSAVRFTGQGGLRVLGVGLLPAGWGALMQADASELADSVLDAEDIFGPLIGDMHEALVATTNIAAMISIVNAGLRALLGRRVPEQHWFTELTDAWLVAGSAPRIDRLFTTSGLSARQVERLTARFYGCSPTMLARKYRTLRAASRLAAGDIDWRDIAGDFYDQSHLIREFRRFTGVTPNILVKRPPPVTRLTLAMRRGNKDLPKLMAMT